MMVVLGIGTSSREVSLPCTPAREVCFIICIKTTPARKAGSSEESNKRCPQRSVILRFWMMLDLLRALIVTIIVGVCRNDSEIRSLCMTPPPPPQRTRDYIYIMKCNKTKRERERERGKLKKNTQKRVKKEYIHRDR